MSLRQPQDAGLPAVPCPLRMLHRGGALSTRRGRRLPLACLGTSVALLSACSLVSSPHRPAERPPGSVQGVPDAVPRAEPRSEKGNPPYYDALGKRYYVMASAAGYAETGIASWYGPDFQAKPTSSGEVYDMYGMTAAHKTLPLPTYARVTNLSNGRSVVVRINDRGPFVANRIIDLSYTAAAKLDMLREGTAVVEVRAITSPGQPLPPAPLLLASQPPPASSPPPAAAPSAPSAPAAGSPGMPRVMPLTATLPAPVPSPAPASAAAPAPAAAPDAASVPAAEVAAIAPAPAQAADTAAAAPAVTPPPPEPPTSAPVRAFYLQAGAFSDPRNAQSVLARLRDAGVAGAFVLEPAPGASLYRVRVGPLASVDEIDRATERLTALGFANTRVISEGAPQAP